MNFLFRLLWIFLLILLMGCSTTRYQADPQTVQKEIRKLETQLRKKPGDTGLLTELGKMHFLARNTEKAREYLTRGLKKSPENGEALFYL
ncbi:MAG: hypothetical protein Kow0037_28460 [Calditrichia bacterium]